MKLRLVFLVVLTLAAPARAQQLAPDDEVARREYGQGAASYAHADYDTALRHFQAAKVARPLPELDFNIARCLDRLGRWSEAADAYDRFVAAKPDAANAEELHARVAILRERATPAALPSTAVVIEPSRASVDAHPRLAAELVLGGALAFGLAGGVVYGTAYHDFSQRSSACQGLCPPSTTTGLRDGVRDREIVSGVLWGVAGVALVADIVLWAKASRAHVRVGGAQ